MALAPEHSDLDLFHEQAHARPNVEEKAAQEVEGSDALNQDTFGDATWLKSPRR